MSAAVGRICAAVVARRFRFTSEADLQTQLDAAFKEDGLALEREHRLTAKERPDFFDVDAGVAVEVKTGGTAAAALRQLWRYAALPAVRELVLVTSVAGHIVPGSIDGKPVLVVRVGGFL